MPDDKTVDETAQAQAQVATESNEKKPKEKKNKPKEGDKFHLKIYSPFKVYFEGEVISVSAVNATGDFDVLAGHHNFLTLISACDITIRTGETGEKGQQTIKIARGIMHVKADDVVVFLDV